MKKERLEQLIAWTFLCAGLYVIWQVVPYFRGEFDIPGFEIPAQYSWEAIGAFYRHYVLGPAALIVLGAFVITIGRFIARICAVGWKQFISEAKYAWQEEQRIAKIESNRRKRREIRRKRDQDNASGNATGSFIVGAIIGSLFF